MEYCWLYSTDASMYQFLPRNVESPLNLYDLLDIVRGNQDASILIPRGAGTSLVGQSIGNGTVLDCSRHLNRVLELNINEGWVRVEPGLVCAELNSYLKPHGYCFAPDPATLNRATIGGMIANNSSGMRSVCYGMTIDHVIDVELVLASGDILRLAPVDARKLSEKCLQDDSEGRIYRGVIDLLHHHADEIRQRYPKVIRRSGGYALDALVDTGQINLAKLICGSEGTLGVILSAKLKLTHLPPLSAVALAHFESVDAALRSVTKIVDHEPSAVELLDGTVLRQAREHPSTRDTCSILDGNPEGILVIEVQGEDPDSVRKHISRIADSLIGRAYACPIMDEPRTIRAVWQLRSSALGLITTVKGPRKPVPYIEDAAIPVEHLADYVSEVVAVCDRYHQPLALFGHASVGLLHIRPLHDLHLTREILSLKAIQEEVFNLVLKYGGSWSGEHGDGIVRGGFNRRFFGDPLYEAFRAVKLLFDPEWRMNPGKVIETPPLEDNLRYGDAYKPIAVETKFHYRDDGGIHGAAEQCSGVGECRKNMSGVMCPSFMLTKEEVHSTRGRANILRLVLSGQLGVHALASEELRMVMEFCLSCKGCKGECPNSVDMAKLKSEVFHNLYKLHGIPLRARMFGEFDGLSRFAAGPQAQLVNRFLENSRLRQLGERLLGIDSGRRLPIFAASTFSRWYKRRPTVSSLSAADVEKKDVVLFVDTYTEYFQPDVGKAVIKVLEAAGYCCHPASFGDSQRTAISQGLLDKAKHEGMKLFQRLDQCVDGKCPILVCEPSCASALKEDLPDLLDDILLAQRVAGRVLTIDQFLDQELVAGNCRIDLADRNDGKKLQILVHTHCHQYVLGGASSSLRLLARIPGAVVQDTEAGCCGMAGSFGYETEHAQFSKDVAAQRLLPRLEKADVDTVIVANGFSCRHQIAELSNRKPVHAIQVISEFLHDDELRS